MASFTLEINGLKEMITRINDEPKALESRLNQVLKSNVNEMVIRARRDAPKDIGRLAGAITAEQRDPLNHAMTCNVEYAPYMEFGTKGKFRAIPGVDASEFKGSGKKGNGFYAAILAWVKRKGLNGKSKSKNKQKQDEQTAYMIYRSILKKGVKPQPFFFKQADLQRAKLEASVKANI